MENDQLTQNRVENNSFTAYQNAQNRNSSYVKVTVSVQKGNIYINMI